MTKKQEPKRLRNWFIGKIHNKLYGDYEIFDRIWTYKADMNIAISRCEEDYTWKVKTTENEVYTLNWNDIDRYFEKDRKRIEKYLESKAIQ